ATLRRELKWRISPIILLNSASRATRRLSFTLRGPPGFGACLQTFSQRETLPFRRWAVSRGRRSSARCRARDRYARLRCVLWLRTRSHSVRTIGLRSSSWRRLSQKPHNVDMPITLQFAFRVRDLHRLGYAAERIADKLGASLEDVMEGHR